jgi:hypothetical protein
MLVSNFSLGFNDYYEFDTGWTAGYRLQITNLADTKIEFDVECRVTQYYFGGTGPNESVPTSLNSMLRGDWRRDSRGYYQQQALTIGPNESEQYHLQPWIYEGRRWTPYVDGYVMLRVPVIRSNQPPYGLIPQTSTPVPVLLSAERVDEWIKRQPPPPDLLTRAQSSFPLASGKAYNEIPPETEPYAHPIRVRQYVDTLLTRDKLSPKRGAMGLPEEDRAQALIDLLGQMTDDQEDITALNQMLEDLGKSVRVAGPGRKAPK